MPSELVECVPNFSEGRDARVVDAIASVIERVPGVAVLHRTMDADHHRSVITFAGSPDAVADAAVSAVGEAVARIDLNRHQGVHPRVGAPDVIPFVPVEGITLRQCANLATEAGREIWRKFHVPVYLYEAAALRPERRKLEDIRRGGWETLRRAAIEEPERAPDIGGPQLHPTAGAAVVGARKVLIAFNVNLATSDLSVAQGIARAIRTSSGGLPHVKALGLRLESRNQTQVSMNLTDFELTPLHVVYEAIRREAAARDVEIAESELIGLMPRAALEQAAAHFLRLPALRSDQVLESCIASALRRKLE